MRIWFATLAVLAGIAQAQPGAPSFTMEAVLPSGTARARPLAPGMLVSIYGRDLGPETACTGYADTQRTETPNPTRPFQSFHETLNYPKELCGVRVFMDGRPAGLLYVHKKQINFKVPQDAPAEGTAGLKVVVNGRSSAVRVQLGPETAVLFLNEPAYVGGPIWVHIDLPHGWQNMVQYPVGIHPADLGCHQLEVRQNGVPLPQIGPNSTGGVRGGLMCGNIGVAGHPMKHPGRLPLHLQYRFEKPGVYEVRYTRRSTEVGSGSADVLLRSAWTPIEVLAARPVRIGPPPQDPAEILSDFLPSLLGNADAARLAIVLDYLYHPNDVVRRFAASGLSYWSSDEIDRRLEDLVRSRGPSDAIVERVLLRAPTLVESILQHLRSDDPVLVRGAVTGVSRVLFSSRSRLTAGAVGRTEDALIRAAEHVIGVGDPQTVINYAAALGAVRDERAHQLLWDLVKRRVAFGQATSAISWLKDPRDLPRLAALLTMPVGGDPLGSERSSLPNALHSTYGEASVPFLEAALLKSEQVWVLTNCARELIIANRRTGFAFVARAIEENRFFKSEMIGFVQGRFPELRGADESAILAFVKQRSK